MGRGRRPAARSHRRHGQGSHQDRSLAGRKANGDGRRTRRSSARRRQRQALSAHWRPLARWSPTCPSRRTGRRLLLGTWSLDPVIVVDTATGQPLPSPAEAVFDAAWSPDGKLLAAAAPGGRVRLWNAVTRRTCADAGRPPGRARRAAGLVGGQQESGGRQQFPCVGLVCQTGKLLWHNDKQQNVGRVAWSPQGQWLATNDIDGKTVRIWEADSGKLVHEVAFSLGIYLGRRTTRRSPPARGGMTGRNAA